MQQISGSFLLRAARGSHAETAVVRSKPESPLMQLSDGHYVSNMEGEGGGAQPRGFFDSRVERIFKGVDLFHLWRTTFY